MRKFLLYLPLVLLFLKSHSQSEAVYSHAIVNPIIYNPAFTGWDEYAHVSFQLRSQWTGYSSSFDGQGGAPNMQTIVGSIPVVGGLSGLGLIIQNDNLGPVTNISFGIPVSYQFDTQAGQWVIGLTPGLISRTQRFDQLRFNDPADPLNLGTQESQLNYNMGVGLAYQYSGTLLFGVSASNLLEPEFNFGSSDLQYKLARTYSFIGSYRKSIGSNLRVHPSTFIQSDLIKFSIDIGSLVYVGDRLWTGFYYRWSEAVIFLIGYSILPQNSLKIGFSFDLVLDQKSSDQLTSQEIYIRYNLPELILGGRKQVKTPRFTY